MKRIVCFFVWLPVMLAACYPDGEEIAFQPPSTAKKPPLGIADVCVSAFLDTGSPDFKDRLLELGNYHITVNYASSKFYGDEYPYFDYVILNGGEIKQGGLFAYLDLSEQLQSALRERKTYLKPLQDKGIKIIVSITGGRDGVSFGSLVDGEQQYIFAKECADMCRFYSIDGVEFYDKDAESDTVNPYPQLGGTFRDFEYKDRVVTLDTPELVEYYYKEGAKNFTDMMSYLIVLFGAESSFQGDVNFTHRIITPILSRETGFGRYLPVGVPRWPFSDLMQCLTYSINNDGSIFGAEGGGMSYNSAVGTRDYAPMQIDLSNNDPAYLDQVDAFSERFGTRDWGTEYAKPGDGTYGLVYYTNIPPYSQGLLDKLNIASNHIFWEDVYYKE